MKIVHSSPELVSTTRTGNAKYWQGHVATDGKRWYTQTSYWQVNQKGVKSVVQTSEPYEASPKNVGRANATTAEQQAYLEFESMVTKQRDKGYSEPGTIADILPLPMLAQKFSERGTKMQWPVHVQPKYNGQRMLFDGKKGWSRGGKQIIPDVIKHIAAEAKHFEGVTLDGELMLPGNVLLQETMKATKKYVAGLSDTLVYMVYDIVAVDLPFSVRYGLLKDMVEKAKTKHIILAPAYLAEDAAEVMRHHKQFVKYGFEGTMVRDDSEGYSIGQRSNQLQKFKDFVDGEFKIVDVVEGDGKFKGAAIFVCETTKGVQFNCTPEGTMEHRRELYKTRKQRVGKWLTIRYQELSKDGVPLFPVGENIREDGDF